MQATENGGVAVLSKKPGNPQQPAKNLVTVTYGPSTGTRKYVPTPPGIIHLDGPTNACAGSTRVSPTRPLRTATALISGRMLSLA